MRTEELSYNLPAELIAQVPARTRSSSRLLVLDRSNGAILDTRFSRLGDFLLPGDCLVLNDTKVIPARFFARRPTGAGLEGLFLAEDNDGIWTVYLKGARRLKPGAPLYLKDKEKADFCEAVLLEKMGDGKCRLKLEDFRSTIFNFQFSIGNPLIRNSTLSILNSIGFPPLPPYIKRDDDVALTALDASRYQTVYARCSGAVAAPTAGLHFTEALMEQLKRAGVHFASVTLHVGAGTFKPITTENIEDHQIHAEWFTIGEENARIINKAKEKGGRIIPVGTTSTRVLETLACKSEIADLKFEIPTAGGSGTTESFITPGYQFKMTDAMITNFHLPKSSLLALVAAFAGLDKILAAYHHAIEQRYRFYSYGDAMLIK
jgi:S-adenosylmethionine:tRNA ribosyltransferase-isomerase